MMVKMKEGLAHEHGILKDAGDSYLDKLKKIIDEVKDKLGDLPIPKDTLESYERGWEDALAYAKELGLMK